MKFWLIIIIIVGLIFIGWMYMPGYIRNAAGDLRGRVGNFKISDRILAPIRASLESKDPTVKRASVINCLEKEIEVIARNQGSSLDNKIALSEAYKSARSNLDKLKNENNEGGVFTKSAIGILNLFSIGSPSSTIGTINCEYK